jgi:D-aspartate ligase
VSGRPRIVVAPTSTDNAIAVMRQLHDAGIAVIGADDGYLPTWLRSRYCRDYRRVADAGNLHVADYLPEIVAAVRPDAVLPVNSPATIAAIRHRPAFPAGTSTNLPPAESFAAAFDKGRTLATCRRLGIPCPDDYELAEATHLLRRRPGGVRLVVKPKLDLGGGRGLQLVEDVAALEAAVRHCDERLGGAVIQEFIPGDTSCLAMLLAVCGGDGRIVAAFTSRKLRQYPLPGGAATLAESTAEGGLVEQMLPLFHEWRWSGPAEVDFKFDARDGRFKVLEVNPRFPSYLGFTVDCGLDVPLLAASLALDPMAVDALPFPAYAVGRRYVCLGPFARVVLEEFVQPGPRFRRLRRTLAEARNAVPSGFWEDPAPFLGRLFTWS